MRKTVTLKQAKSSLCSLVDALACGRKREIILTQGGRPVAKLVPIATAPTGQRIGVAKGLFTVPDTIDTSSKEVAQSIFWGKG